MNNESLVKAPNFDPPPKSVLLAPTKGLCKLVSQSATSKASTQKLLFDSINYRFFNDVAVVGPVLGSPATLAACEGFLQSGTKSIYLLSACGGLDTSKLSIGDIIIPVGAISEEGTSRLYGAEEHIPIQNPTLQSEVGRKLVDENHRIHFGPIWTTDAPFRETAQKVTNYRSAGAIGVDMEYAAVLQLCNVYRAELAAAFVVSDLLSDSWQAGFADKKVKKSLKHIANTITTELGI